MPQKTSTKFGILESVLSVFGIFTSSCSGLDLWLTEISKENGRNFKLWLYTFITKYSLIKSELLLNYHTPTFNVLRPHPFTPNLSHLIDPFHDDVFMTINIKVGWI